MSEEVTIGGMPAFNRKPIPTDKFEGEDAWGNGGHFTADELASMSQPNNGALLYDVQSGNLTLTNPPPQLIYLYNTGAPVSGFILQFAEMGVAGAWKAGTNVIKIYNNTSNTISLAPYSEPTDPPTPPETIIDVPAGFRADVNVQNDLPPIGLFTIDIVGSAASKAASSFQSNNGKIDLNMSTDASLTNPLPTIIRLINVPDNARKLFLPDVSESNAPDIGLTSTVIINDNDFQVRLQDASDHPVQVIPPYTIAKPYLLDKTVSPSQNGTWWADVALQSYNNLFDLTDAPTARMALGLGSAAVANDADFLQTANNFSDVSNPAAARTNIGLGSSQTPSFAGLNLLLSPLGIASGGTNANTLAGAQTNMQIIGIQEQQISFRPASANGAAITQSGSYANGADFEFIPFSQSSINYATSQIKMPKRYDGQPFNILVPYYSDVSDNGIITWFADAAFVDINGTDFNALEFGTPVSVNATLAGGQANTENDLFITGITPSGAPATNNPTILLRIYRKGGTSPDTFAGPALLMQNGLMQWNADQGNDG